MKFILNNNGLQSCRWFGRISDRKTPGPGDPDNELTCSAAIVSRKAFNYAKK